MRSFADCRMEGRQYHPYVRPGPAHSGSAGSRYREVFNNLPRSTNPVGASWQGHVNMPPQYEAYTATSTRPQTYSAQSGPQPWRSWRTDPCDLLDTIDAVIEEYLSSLGEDGELLTGSEVAASSSASWRSSCDVPHSTNSASWQRQTNETPYHEAHTSPGTLDVEPLITFVRSKPAYVSRPTTCTTMPSLDPLMGSASVASGSASINSEREGAATVQCTFNPRNSSIFGRSHPDSTGVYARRCSINDNVLHSGWLPRPGRLETGYVPPSNRWGNRSSSQPLVSSLDHSHSTNSVGASWQRHASGIPHPEMRTSHGSLVYSSGFGPPSSWAARRAAHNQALFQGSSQPHDSNTEPLTGFGRSRPTYHYVSRPTACDPSMGSVESGSATVYFPRAGYYTRAASVRPTVITIDSSISGRSSSDSTPQSGIQHQSTKLKTGQNRRDCNDLAHRIQTLLRMIKSSEEHLQASQLHDEQTLKRLSYLGKCLKVLTQRSESVQENEGGHQSQSPNHGLETVTGFPPRSLAEVQPQTPERETSHNQWQPGTPEPDSSSDEEVKPSVETDRPLASVLHHTFGRVKQEQEQEDLGCFVQQNSAPPQPQHRRSTMLSPANISVGAKLCRARSIQPSEATSRVTPVCELTETIMTIGAYRQKLRQQKFLENQKLPGIDRPQPVHLNLDDQQPRIMDPQVEGTSEVLSSVNVNPIDGNHGMNEVQSVPVSTITEQVASTSKFSQPGGGKARRRKKSKRIIKCYYCRQSGHLMQECLQLPPLLKKS